MKRSSVLLLQLLLWTCSGNTYRKYYVAISVIYFLNLHKCDVETLGHVCC